MTPTARTKQYLEKYGFRAAVVERINTMIRPPVRHDVWGFGDLLAYSRTQKGAMLVQTTSRANHVSRRKKILGILEAWEWVNGGNHILLISWAKNKQKRWEPTVEWIQAESFNREELRSITVIHREQRAKNKAKREAVALADAAAAEQLELGEQEVEF